MLAIVTSKPEILIGVKGSWKTIPAAEIVITSLKIPHMLSVTTEVRCSNANSVEVRQNANVPGNSKSNMPRMDPFSAVNLAMPSASAEKPSMGMASSASERNMIGVRKKILLKGLLVAAFLNSKIWVSAQRKPEKNAELMIRRKPRASNAVSPATIITTPTVMVNIMRQRVIEGDSRRKRKAKRRTKARAEDLHIAGR